MRLRRSGLAATAAGVLMLSACSSGAWNVSVGGPGSSDLGELSENGGEPCPDVLPDASDEYGLGVSSSAIRTPAPLEFDAAWLCEYVTDDGTIQEDGNGMTYGWLRRGQPIEFSADGLEELAAALSTIAPPEDSEGMACTADLGPRLLVVTALGEDLTGIAVDDFGCRWVRLTEDPYVTAPGESQDLPAGYLLGDDGIVDRIEAAARA